MVILRRGASKPSHFFTSTKPCMPAAMAETFFLVNLVTLVKSIHEQWMMDRFISCVEKHLLSMCLMVCEESSQRPLWRATMVAVVEEPLIRPTDDTLCPLCCSTCPFICTENTSGSELIPTRCRLTEAWAHRLTSGKKGGDCWSVCVFYLSIDFFMQAIW